MTSPRFSAFALPGIAIILLLATPALAREKTKSWDGANGHGGTTSVSRSGNGDGSGWSKNRSTIYNSGASSSSERDVTKTDDGYNVSGSHTGPKGNTQTYDGTVTKTGDGSWSSSGSYTTSNDHSGTYEGSAEKTETGHQTSGTLTNQDGETATREATTSYNDGTVTREGTTTSFGGRVKNWVRSNKDYNE